MAGVDVNEGQTRIGGGIAITRALGDHFAKDNESGMIAVPHISEAIKLSPEDTHLVLASDGVSHALLLLFLFQTTLSQLPFGGVLSSYGTLSQGEELSISCVHAPQLMERSIFSRSRFIARNVKIMLP